MDAIPVIVVGGGAAGCFAAAICAEARPDRAVQVLEQGPRLLAKVRISGGGRCNVTHACFDPARLATAYPRGGRALRGPFERFQPRDMMAWLEPRGVRLKVEPDGRVFPVTDSAETIIDALLQAGTRQGVDFQINRGVTAIHRTPDGFELELNGNERRACRRLLLATGGARGPFPGDWLATLGHGWIPPVPSLFTFTIPLPWLRSLAGLALPQVELAVPGAGLREQGSLLITHWGLSGPVVLRLSAWGARALHASQYTFPLRVNWLPEAKEPALQQELQTRRQTQAARLVVNGPLAPLPGRLWEQLVLASGIDPATRWSALPNAAIHRLVQTLTRSELPVSGKSLNKEEFVTCGGVPLGEVNFRTMESRICPGLHFAGEVLDIDGLTGGFNLQAAWTTGWIAGRAMAEDTDTV